MDLKTQNILANLYRKLNIFAAVIFILNGLRVVLALQDQLAFASILAIITLFVYACPIFLLYKSTRILDNSLFMLTIGIILSLLIPILFLGILFSTSNQIGKILIKEGWKLSLADAKKS